MDAFECRELPQAAGTACDGGSPLPERATAWIDVLRKRGQTRALAAMLAQCGEWTIAYDADGTRSAPIHRNAAS
jgi:hypothetical protein